MVRKKKKKLASESDESRAAKSHSAPKVSELSAAMADANITFVQNFLERNPTAVQDIKLAIDGPDKDHKYGIPVEFLELVFPKLLSEGKDFSVADIAEAIQHLDPYNPLRRDLELQFFAKLVVVSPGSSRKTTSTSDTERKEKDHATSVFIEPFKEAFDANDLVQASVILESHQAEFGDHPRFINAAATLAYKKDDIAEAISILTGAIQRGCTEPRLYRTLTVVLFENGQLGDAEHWARAGLHDHPQDDDLKYNLAAVLKSLGGEGGPQKYVEAIKLFSDLSSAHPDNGEYAHELLDAYALTENFDAILKSSVSIDIFDNDYHRLLYFVRRSEARIVSGRFDDALVEIKQALHFDHDRAAVWLQALLIAEAVGGERGYTEAVSLANDAKTKENYDWNFEFVLARISRMHLANYKQAEKHLDAALNAPGGSESPAIFETMALNKADLAPGVFENTAHRSKKARAFADELISLLDRAVDLNSHSARLRRVAACIWAGHNDRVRQDLEVLLANDETRPAALYHEGNFLFLETRYAEAAEKFKEAFDLGFRNPWIYLNLCKVYLFLDQLFEARLIAIDWRQQEITDENEIQCRHVVSVCIEAVYGNRQEALKRLSDPIIADAHIKSAAKRVSLLLEKNTEITAKDIRNALFYDIVEFPFSSAKSALPAEEPANLAIPGRSMVNSNHTDDSAAEPQIVNFLERTETGSDEPFNEAAQQVEGEPLDPRVQILIDFLNNPIANGVDSGVELALVRSRFPVPVKDVLTKLVEERLGKNQFSAFVARACAKEAIEIITGRRPFDHEVEVILQTMEKKQQFSI